VWWARRTPELTFTGKVKAAIIECLVVCLKQICYGYIPQTLESLNIKPGFFVYLIIQKWTKKVRWTNKENQPFKRRQLQLNKQKISETLKEAKEGTMYEGGIGLTLNSSETARELNNSELSIPELYGVNAVTKHQQQEYENAVPQYTTKPSVHKEKFDISKCYNFVLFDIETNSMGKSAEVCQFAAVDRSGKRFSWYILPNRDIDSYTSKVNKLTVKTVNGIR